MPTEPSPPKETPTSIKPSWWVQSTEGGKRVFSVITAILPPDFTNQGGASIFGDVIIDATAITMPVRSIIGTQFAFGIWPTVDQVDYQKPVEFRITLDAAQVAPGTEGQLALMMYNPNIGQWETLPSQFRPETYQIVTYVQSFKPVPKDFPAWGGRTFFIVAYPELTAPTQASSTSVVNRNANLRVGPGIVYDIIGKARIGQSIQLIEKSANGRWYKLENGAWIAAFLVDNVPELPIAQVTPVAPTLSPSPTSKPIQTPTPTSMPTISS